MLTTSSKVIGTYLEELVPHKAKNDVLFLLEHGKWRPADELIARVDNMLEGNEEFALIDEAGRARAST